MSSRDLDAFLASIDEVTAPTCATCTKPLADDGPSLYYCDDICSDRWHATQAEPLSGYREPWRRPQDFPGIGTDAHNTQADEYDADGWAFTAAGGICLAVDQFLAAQSTGSHPEWPGARPARPVTAEDVTLRPTIAETARQLAQPVPVRLYTSNPGQHGGFGERWTAIGHVAESLRFEWADTERIDGVWLSDTEGGPVRQIRFDQPYVSLSTAPPPEVPAQPEVSGSYTRVSVTWGDEQ